MIVGMDFGTTNSGMAVYDGRSVTVLPLDPANTNPRVLRTALYVTNDQTVHIGRTAVDQYFEQNIGRPVKMQKVWIGEIEVYGADMYYVTDAYAWVDVYSPGRLLLSIKTSLRDADYPGTIVGQFYYSLENLIATYLTTTRARAERLLGRELRQVVLGRPVRFSTDPEHDRLAQSRLLQAAFRAGYEKVYFQYEPIAAAFNYETMIAKEENVLVFDFGGGTLDITVMRLGNRQRRAVLATGGIPVAGDVFDQKLVQAKLTRHFGQGSEYGPRHKSLTVPQWVYNTFSNWQTILELQSAENRKILQEIAQTARRRYQIEALVNLVSSNYGLKMFDIVERAKRTLSDKRGAEILLDGPGFHVRDFVTRSEFENIIRNEIVAIDRHLDETLAASGLTAGEIDAVIRTGGSSEIPVFHDMLARKFGADKVRRIDIFSSVTSGLGVIAHEVEQGEIELKAYTPDEVALPASPDSPYARPNVSPINLEMVRRRIVMAEQAPAAPVTEGTLVHNGEALAGGKQQALVLVNSEGQVTAALIAAECWQQGATSLSTLGIEGASVQAVMAGLDEPLLLITSKYRFLLVTARQLADLSSIGLTVADLHQLVEHEKICTVSRWDEMNRRQKLLLATSLGFVRPYPMDVIKGNIEAPVPLKFDYPLFGDPVAALGTEEEDELVLVTSSGRAVRFAVKSLRLSGLQAVNCGGDDRVTAALLARPGDEVALVTADGYGRRLLAEWVPVPPKANTKGMSMVARRSDLVAATTRTPDLLPWLITSKRLVKVETGQLPLEESTRTERLLSLEPGETVHTLFTDLTVNEFTV
ncbi:MAG TPA: Hsp70 family protein [Anaerolineae bacterium]